MLVSDLMSSPVHVCLVEDTVSHVRNLMLKHHISRVLVMDNAHVAGIITRKDIGFRLKSRDPAWRRRSADNEIVSSLMTTDIISISPGSSVRDALILMVNHQISGFPVIDQGMVLGMVTKSDMMKAPLITGLDIPVNGVMHDVSVVTQKHSVDHVIDLMMSGCTAVVVIGDDGTPAGIISESDLAFARDGHDQLEKMLAGEIMHSPVITVEETARTGDVVHEMVTRNVASLVITSVQGIKGIITRDDIIKEVAQ